MNAGYVLLRNGRRGRRNPNKVNNDLVVGRLRAGLTAEAKRQVRRALRHIGRIEMTLGWVGEEPADILPDDDEAGAAYAAVAKREAETAAYLERVISQADEIAMAAGFSGAFVAGMWALDACRYGRATADATAQGLRVTCKP